MESARHFAAGNYRYVKRMKQFSGGVAADSGHAIRRVRLQAALPLEQAWALVRETMERDGRSLTALCAVELRSPAPFSEQGFRDFNALYLGTLAAWGLYEEGGDNPVARVNVCPALQPPAVPSLHAFSYTVPMAGAAGDFVLAGAAEAPETEDDYRDTIIAWGDTSGAGMLQKADWVLGELGRRLAALGAGWEVVTAMQVYTVHPLHAILRDIIGTRAAALSQGVTWHFCRPPVMGLEFEAECRRVWHEIVLETPRA